jgi:hypothetical protein
VPGADRNLQLPTNTGQVTEVVGFGNDALERETKSSEFNEIHCVPKATLSRDCWRKITPPLLLWAIWRLGYDRRGWLYQTLTAWVVVPVNYFWPSAVRRELGPGPLLPRATHYARPALPAGISSRGPAGRIFSHPPAAAMVGPAWRLSAGRRKEKIVKSPRFHQPFSVSEIADFNNYFQ